MTPSSHARFIGRVGALAVALGIGAAIANSPGIATADESSPSTSADSAANSAGASTDSSTSKPAEPTGKTDAKPTADDDDEPAAKPTDEVDKADPADEEQVGDKAAPADEEQAPEDDETHGADESTAAEPTQAHSSNAKEVDPQSFSRATADTPASVADEPAAPPESPVGWTMLARARREIGEPPASSSDTATPTATPTATSTAVPTAASTAALTTAAPAAETVSPLATPEQLAAERLARQTAHTLPVVLMKILLRQQFLAAGRRLYPEGIDAENMAALDRAVNEYAMGAAFQQQLLDSMNPKVVAQVAPPHDWFNQEVPGSRILYDNPDTIYRFMGVNGASSYVITGRLHDLTEAGRPADITFSVLEGLSGTTSSILTADDLEINPDGTFVITVSTKPANGRKNHLQLTSGSTIIAARDTLGDWNTEVPMSLSIERVGGPPDSLFAQIGGFAFLGPRIVGNPLLTNLVSLIPPLPYMPPLLRGVFTAAILVVRGASEQTKYMALATHDPQTGQRRPVNEVSQPASNAEFLANQRQSNGHFQLADDEALVLTIDPGSASYFVVPTYNIWTITDDYWNQPASLNNEQIVGGTYTVVISPTDPGVANWVSTGGLNQGTIAIRFQGLADSDDPPSIVEQRVVSHAALRDILPPEAFVTTEERAEQIARRKAGFDNRWAT